jgi:hypothetical protein
MLTPDLTQFQAVSPNVESLITSTRNAYLSNNKSPILYNGNNKSFVATYEYGNENFDNSLKNALLNATNTDFAYKVALDTLTKIRDTVISQKYYEISPSDFVPVRVGFGAWNRQLMTYAITNTADSFEQGDIDIANSSRLSRSQFQALPVYTKIKSWASESQYDLTDINQAMQSGNWSLVERLEAARSKYWQLGIQKIAALGHSYDAGILGLLNQTAVASDTTTITTPIANMTAAQLQTLLKNMFAVYFANSNNTQTKPDTFAIATKDWLGMATAASDPTYAGMGLSKASYLQQQFREITQNPDAKIVPLLYCDKSVSKLANNRYVLYKRDNEVMEMNIPVSYTSTVAGSYNNFQFQSVAYGQYTGLQLFRPKEVLYFDFSGTI